MTLEIVKYPDPILRQKGKPVGEVNEEVRQLAEDMIETMRAANGVGLAAQQIGKAVQLTVLEVEDSEDRPSAMTINGTQVNLEDWMPMVLLDPVLDLGREKEAGTEGCLSFPDITAEIERSASVKAKGRLLDGSEIEFEATGLLARALQHEVDHLNGILFINRMSAATKLSINGKLKRLQREAQV
ncbi:MAG TPA: peptide deformylase [Chthoniobacteraceae bacterium]|jgi:peptide deformylase|nr:peptide deformylase [Chthoniobacteraceae bacterium]